jgi:energy-coupling factor transporter ATP-binding protein EcfA2
MSTVSSVPPSPVVGVRARGLSASVAGRRLLAPIDLDVVPGRTLCVLGPAGSGKSTLLSIIAGRTAPGIAVDGDVAVAGRIASMPQRCPLIDATLRDLLHAIDPDRDPVAMIAEVWPGSTVGPFARRLLDIDLHDHDRPGCRLAGLTYLVARRPDVIVLDEPEAGQPDVVRDELAGLVRRLTDRSTAVVIATHHLELARTVADDVVVLPAGATFGRRLGSELASPPSGHRMRRLVGLGTQGATA